MTKFYHVSPVDHPIGMVIQPGNYGSLYSRYVQKGNICPQTPQQFFELTWESVLETARLLAAPQLPSRLNCVFACTTLESAVAFRDRFRSGAFVFEIEASDDAPVHRGDISSISNTLAGEALIVIWSRTAAKYWTDASPKVTEVIIGGPVSIVRKISDNGEAITQSAQSH
jgi:hypothetical protein